MRCVSYLFLVLAMVSGHPAGGQSFDVASVKLHVSGPGLSCNGGPARGIWSCTNLPLGLLISRAFHFAVYEFSPRDQCCQSRFDIDARFPAGTTKVEFDRMLQNFLRERFRLSFHYERKPMPVYELTLAARGLKMKPSAEADRPQAEDTWWQPRPYRAGKDGYPEFENGAEGLMTGLAGRNRWLGFNIGTDEIAKTLTEQTGRPVLDATGLKGRYDIDLKWVTDLSWNVTEQRRAELEAEIGQPLDTPNGPNLLRAVQDQLGLRLASKNGSGQVVVIDHVNKVPTEN